jgi:hypothetical protein
VMEFGKFLSCLDVFKFPNQSVQEVTLVNLLLFVHLTSIQMILSGHIPAIYHSDIHA